MIDRMAEKYVPESPFTYAINNPINLIHPNGEEVIVHSMGTTYTGMDAQTQFRRLQSSINVEPRYGQLGDKSEILGEVSNALDGMNTYEMSMLEQVNVLARHFEGNRRFVRNGRGELVDAPGSVNVVRYVYTERGGWIDMHHFFYMAGEAIAKTPANASTFSYLAEFIQEINGSPSAFSYEDLPSNAYGIEFVMQNSLQAALGMTASMVDLVSAFLDQLGAVEPEAAPNFPFIPHMANDNVPQNFSSRPLTGDQLRNVHETIHRNRPANERRNIQQAHETIRR